MSSEPTKLVQFLDRRAGDGLRAVAEYDEDGHTLVYVRDGLDTDGVAKAMREVYQNVQSSTSEHSFVEERLGGITASVQLRERGVTLNLHAESGGVLVSMDRSVARNLDMFTQQCLEVLYGTRCPDPSEPA